MFIEAKDDGGGGDNWSYKSCKAPVKSSPPTNRHPVFYRPDALPVTQPTVSKHWREKYHIPWTCLPEAHLGVFHLCLWPLIAPGYLGGGCHASHQPSDASTPVSVQRQMVIQHHSISVRWLMLHNHFVFGRPLSWQGSLDDDILLRTVFRLSSTTAIGTSQL